MKQFEIADLFDQIADLLELRGGENPFRVRAYRRAAISLRSVTEDLEELAKQGSLAQISGIGRDLADKICEYLSTGKIKFLQKLSKEFPLGLVMLVEVPGVGPKTAKLLYERLKVKSMQDLEKMIQAGKLRKLPGMGEKKELNILQGLELVKSGQQRMFLAQALPLGREVIRQLKKLPQVKEISLGGSLRRWKEVIRDIDVVVASSDPKKVMERFVRLDFVARIQGKGQTKSSIRTHQGTQIDLRVVEPSCFGAAMVYFTGSKEHNIKIRGLANRMGLTVNEYGVFKIKSGKKVAGQTEEEVYRALGMDWVAPELREDQGEVEAARQGKLPRLAQASDLLGCFHNHTEWSDGSGTLEEVARTIKAQGYRYMTLTDHSQSLNIARGLTPKKLSQQMGQVRSLNKRLAPFRILMGSEVDILAEGKLDFPDSVLAKLDFVIASIHSRFKQPGPEMTRRIIRAMENRFVNLLAHPTGRLLGKRKGYEVDLAEVSKTAARTQTAMEINSTPDRQDLNDSNARQAREAGAKLAISADMHRFEHLKNMELGLGIARRAWAGPKDLLNQMNADELTAWVQAKRKKN